MKIVIIEKTGTVKTQNVKNFQLESLYKKCLFRKPDSFGKRHTWTVKINNKTYNIALFAKDKGKATTENKYDLPPPVDNIIYYGSMALVNFDIKDGDETDVTDFTEDEWEKIYEKLFGGFEDIEDTDDEEETDELENVPKKYLTKKGGYLKDGFVVDTGSEEETEDSDYSSRKSSPRENTVITVKTSKKDNTSKKNKSISDIELDNEPNINDTDNSDADDEEDIGNVNQDNSDEEDNDIGGEEEEAEEEEAEEEEYEDDENQNQDINKDVDDSDNDESYIAGSDSDSDNSSELSESAYCEYSDED